jgi:hypothetical protein
VNYQEMTISELALEIVRDWKGKIHYGAKPYLGALLEMETIEQDYYADTGVSVVEYFLVNCSSWRGPVARVIKEELRRRVKEYRLAKAG